MFEEERAELLAPLARAIETADSGGVRSEAHKLKGTFGTLAAAEAAELASQLERAGSQGDLSGIVPLFESMHKSVDAIGHDLQIIAEQHAGRSTT